MTYKENNRIYVEITKEYDKNEKLIKKFVLRKNRLNAIRSETNCGIAIESININLQKALNFVPFLLISSATSIPNL